MEAKIIVPTDTDMGVLEAEYPDIDKDDLDDIEDVYFIGSDEEYDDESEDEQLGYDEAVDCCGFVEGAIPKKVPS